MVELGLSWEISHSKGFKEVILAPFLTMFLTLNSSLICWTLGLWGFSFLRRMTMAREFEYEVGNAGWKTERSLLIDIENSFSGLFISQFCKCC